MNKYFLGLIISIAAHLGNAAELKVDKKNLICKDILGSEIKDAQFGNYEPLKEKITYDPKYRKNRDSMLYFASCDPCEISAYRHDLAYFMHPERPSIQITNTGPSQLKNEINIDLDRDCKIIKIRESVNVNDSSPRIEVDVNPNSGDCEKTLNSVVNGNSNDECNDFRLNLKKMLCRKYGQYIAVRDSKTVPNKENSH